MNINLLKSFIAIAETQSLSRAAERLFVTQPALSQQIKQLENHFSVQLIERTNRGILLTEAGRILYDYASRIVSIYEDLEKNMEDFRASISGTLIVGASSIVGGYAVPCSIFIFKEKYPETNIKLKVGNRKYILEELRDGAIDVAIIEGEKPIGNFVSSEIASDEMVVIAPNREPWNGKDTLSPEEFLSQPIIMREDGSGTRQMIEKCLMQAGIDKSRLNIVMELSSADSIKAAVEAGHGISIMPRLAVRKELYNKTLVALKIEGVPLVQKIHLAYKREKVKSQAAKAFIKFMHTPNRGFC
ncbi:selenium metabolism-associated LysR family transcriptional regulator [Thermosediminibacter oceani]|uniref:Transcriptional regulator, LysR family n=1 Tax=Thermosediminibacter oceani (strain ATCC BAA-1034 / DSM 16646 / JW/IW-1228P) TaxID=555079 RepID=D9RZH7_THEOJ|nr:selenium metabolism-associated LysR family transcriptional regulator [Thermosediminibacter oceani]ADL06875.1 transcriptional regulator, LysR family [Thermosediminibacter oceani DSM 16646]